MREVKSDRFLALLSIMSPETINDSRGLQKLILALNSVKTEGEIL